MKKLILAFFLVLLMAASALGAGSVTYTKTKVGSNLILLKFSFIADAAAATIPAKTTSEGYRGYVYLMVTDPGSTAPTDNYDITLTDSNSIDVLGGAGANRDTATTEGAVPTIDTGASTKGGWPVKGTLTLNISGNAMNSATGDVYVYIYSDDPVITP